MNRIIGLLTLALLFAAPSTLAAPPATPAEREAFIEYEWLRSFDIDKVFRLGENIWTIVGLRENRRGRVRVLCQLRGTHTIVIIRPFPAWKVVHALNSAVIHPVE